MVTNHKPLNLALVAASRESAVFTRRGAFAALSRDAATLGFTLIELILVMALLGIVIGVSAPALSNFFRGRNLDNEGRRFVALTRYAQSRAVSEGVPMIVWINMRQGIYGLEQEPGYSLADTNARSFTLGKDLQIATMDLPGIT